MLGPSSTSAAEAVDPSSEPGVIGYPGEPMEWRRVGEAVLGGDLGTSAMKKWGNTWGCETALSQGILHA